MDMGCGRVRKLRKCGDCCAPFRGVTGLGRSLSPYQVASSSIQLFEHNTPTLQAGQVDIQENGKFWQHQDVIYDFKAEIHGTGSRSCY